MDSLSFKFSLIKILSLIIIYISISERIQIQSDIKKNVSTFTDGIVDMIMEMKLPDLPNGINETAGMCGMEHRSAYQRYPAPAYSINEGAMITISTNEVKFIFLKFSLNLLTK